MKHIESAKNQKVKDWKKLHTKKERTKTNTFLIEGEHLLEEALKTPGTVKEIIILDEADMPDGLDPDIACYLVSRDAFLAISETETPQSVAAVCRMPDSGPFQYEKLLLADAIQDPGNLGTIIRTADAAGIDAVVVGHGTVDPYNAKTLRSAQGSHFHIPIIKAELSGLMKELKEKQIPVYGTALQHAVPFKEAEPSDSFALLIGNEGSGVDPELLAQTDRNLYIPIYGKAESLNVAAAAAVLLYHLRG
ncbi:MULTISPECIES: TrmH family RNA methyltransferase [Bacillus]|uniref:TrmH family RNA methyltransferase n=1 Tax=Bacillus TaxID=1386 RepID=UPI000408ED34|nr:MULTISPECIES: RNA methyltransferase [Bacillus]QHZ47983.1 RNA methyltransferase [Bacillus sp. NSP9.1]WFA04065.1 RNA methyltransferase [Bacillus sp. HSf4]